VLNGVQRLEHIRPIALACSVMVVPEPVRGTRSLLLESMAAGRTVVAMEDAQSHYLIDGVTALVAQDRNPAEWTRLLTKAMLDPATSSAVGAEGALRMAAQYGSSRCAAQVLEACTVAVHGPVLPFQAS
jgi:glycosyltransferase involved in cell wall biosynthesis